MTSSYSVWGRPEFQSAPNRWPNNKYLVMHHPSSVKHSLAILIVLSLYVKDPVNAKIMYFSPFGTDIDNVET